ncbi:hypothetical protein DM02DRAFT_145456 [Periconia macrospinosa]|uniref:Transmembrane protein n=1 Tax=Periconia macrospinosa TaxID=97972 RepID=A0A2V1E5D2_9PLEO|nr:hypothetical protein DM02DRAFT_145456 [Periconia macrospinosa]
MVKGGGADLRPRRAGIRLCVLAQERGVTQVRARYEGSGGRNHHTSHVMSFSFVHAFHSRYTRVWLHWYDLRYLWYDFIFCLWNKHSFLFPATRPMGGFIFVSKWLVGETAVRTFCCCCCCLSFLVGFIFWFVSVLEVVRGDRKITLIPNLILAWGWEGFFS